MTREHVAARFGVNVMRIERPRKRGQSQSYYVAFHGGNGTGEPVVEMAEAFTLRSLAAKLERLANVK